MALGTPPGDIHLEVPGIHDPLARLHGHHDSVSDLAPSPDGKLLLSASLDQTLKIWNIAKPGEEKLLLTLFFAGEDWIIWTPEGYYAATPGGEKLMGWTVFHGFDKLKSFYPAERFRKQLYRPDVIKLVLEKGSVAEAHQGRQRRARRKRASRSGKASPTSASCCRRRSNSPWSRKPTTAW